MWEQTIMDVDKYSENLLKILSTKTFSQTTKTFLVLGLKFIPTIYDIEKHVGKRELVFFLFLEIS